MGDLHLDLAYMGWLSKSALISNTKLLIAKWSVMFGGISSAAW